ncbi:MAG: hypothetical protein COB81_00075 [Flavobacteriaceae bacterium]|nr:MAG: hypothetical protein COB81_00075 [Flavobacteriaceae bacterium]
MIQIDWSENAKIDLKLIFDKVKKKTYSKKLDKNAVDNIYLAGITIQFTAQYQIDETLGQPYRRIIVSHYKIIYKPINKNHIRILEVFDTYQNPIRLRK